MKRQGFRILLTMLMSMTSIVAFAYDAKVNDIYYNFSGTEATVTYLYSSSSGNSNSSAYSGSIVVPETVTYNGTTYSVTSIGNSAFYSCRSLTSLSIPSSVTSIGNGAFSKCSGLTSIVVEDGNTVYDSRNNCNAIIRTSDNTLLAGCKNSEIPLGVTSIGDMAFSCSGLTSLTIPSSVTSIGNNAFDGCSGLTSLTIPSSVTSIGDNVFYSCSGLTSVIVGWDSPLVIGNSVFSSSNNQNATLYVPKGTKAAYEAAAVWQNFGDIKEKLDKSDGAVSDSQGIRYTANDDESTCYVSGHDDTYSSDIIIPNTFKFFSPTTNKYFI